MPNSDQPFDEFKPVTAKIEIVEAEPRDSSQLEAANPKRSWMDKPAPVDPLVGQSIGGYRILSRLGGGMSVVYKAQDERANRFVAVKFLPVEKLEQSKQVQRFQQEARAAARLKDEHIATVYDYGMHERQPYIVMEFIEGTVLSELLMRKKTLSVDETLHIADQLCLALAAALNCHIVHRDIKPGNIIVTRDNKVKLVDFGIAKMAESSIAPGLTKTDEIFGSPLYMSPEQCSGQKVDQRSDYYSLGCVIYECLTGAPPHIGKSVVETIFRHLHDKPLTLKEATLGAEFSDNMESLVEKLLNKAPAARYQTPDEIAKDIDRIRKGEDTPKSQSERQSQPWSWTTTPTRQGSLQRLSLTSPPVEKHDYKWLLVVIVCLLAYAFYNIYPPKRVKNETRTQVDLTQTSKPKRNALALQLSNPKEVVELKLAAENPLPAEWKAIGALPNLRVLNLESTLVSPEGLDCIRHLPLVLVRTHLQESGREILAALQTSKQLRGVQLDQSDLSDADLQLLNQNIEDLSLAGDSISSTALIYISRCRKLRTLNLDFCMGIRFDKDAAKVLASMPSLKYMSLHDCRLAADFIPSLCALRRDIAIER